MMDHNEALRTQAVERYLLGTLCGKDREDFEEHYFDCVVCAEEVTTGVILVDNAAAVWKADSKPAVVREAKKKSAWADWFRFDFRQPAFAMPAFAAILVAGLWISDHSRLATQLADATSPQSFATVPLEDARGSSPAAAVRNGRFFAVAFYLDSPASYNNYTIEITGNGISPATVPATQPPAGASFNVLLPAAHFEAGTYTFTVRGEAPGSPVLKTFTLALK